MSKVGVGLLGRVWWLVVVVVVLIGGGEGQGTLRCPQKCLCFRTTVRCMFLGLKRIPNVPVKTTILDLRFNKIRNIPSGHFNNLKHLHTLLLNNNHINRLQNGSFTGLESLRYLYLYKNRIRVIEPGVFQGLNKLEQLYLHFNDLGSFEANTFSNLSVLERLYLHFNKIERLVPDVFSNLNRLLRLFLHNNRLQRIPRGAFSNLHSLRRLRLDSNALVCDCKMVWLAQMVKEKQHTTQVAATCQYPTFLQGKSLTSLTDNEFQCIGQPSIKEGPQDVEIIFGGTASFTCQVEGDPQPDVVWLHNNEIIRDSDRYTVLRDGTLMIENTQDADMGFYECLASNEMGEVKSRKAKMAPDHELHDEGTRTTGNDVTFDVEPIATPPAIVPTKPRFLRVPNDVNVTEGEPAQIECHASGVPQPDIVWTTGDTPIVEGPRIQVSNEGALFISATNRNDSGTYRCTAANRLGRIAAAATLRVYVPPRLIVEPDDKYARPGSNIQFTCRADGVPLPIITWIKDGRPVVPFGGLTISLHGIHLGVTHVKHSDEGEYICRAQNPAGVQEASAVLYVRDRVAPVIRKEPRDVTALTGQDVVVLECRVEGRPRPLIVWRKDGSVIRAGGRHRTENDGTLYIYNVTSDDAGTYECSAQNLVGFDNARATLTVQESPRPSVGDQFLHQSFQEAQHQVDRALNDTISVLFKRDRGQVHSPHELLRIFRYPQSEGREIARAAEMMERTLQIVKTHVENGMSFNLSTFNYKDLLSPEKLILLRNISGCLAHRRTVYCDDMCFHSRFRSIDGSCNNLRNPLWGASLTGFRRSLPPIYENGFNTPIGWTKTKRYHGFFKPSARLVSSRVMSTEQVSPDHHCTHMLMQWGQFLDHDIDHALPSIATESFVDGNSCQRTCDYAAPCFPIEIPPDDPRIRNHRCMEFTRSSAICGSGMTSVFFDDVQSREQINQLTSFLDASQVYGSSESEMRILRNLTDNKGRMREGYRRRGSKPLLPFSNGAPVDCRRDFSESAIDCFLAGDIRANEQSGLTAMHTLWFREHNRIADALLALNSHWDGDRVYHEARKIVGAEMQHITYTHWLPHIIGPQGMEMLGEYKGYNPDIEPTISNVFATAAYRFGHSLVNPILHRLNASFQAIPEGHLPLHKAFFSPWRIVQEGGIDPLLRGLFATPAKLKTPGQFLNTELTEKLFRAAHEVALDLAALNIQRGRDHGLPGYNEWRAACNLSVAETFHDLASHISSSEIREQLKQLYGHPGNVDLWVGGLLEDPVEGARVGPTFLCILVDQFRRLRDGDRLWYENPTTFKPEQLQEIRYVSLGRVMCDNGDSIRDVTSDAFILPREQNPAFISCTEVPKVNLRIWTECCSDCQHDGSFNSLTQNSGIRFRRQADYTLREDREHQLMGQASNDVGATPSENWAHFPANTSDNGYKRSKEPVATSSFDTKSEVHRDWVVGVEIQADNVEDIGNYEMDLTEERIEGIELLVEQLSKTVLELNQKVSTLERMCGGGVRRRRRRQCTDEEGVTRRPGETWMKDTCTTCKCRRRTVRCRVLSCPPVHCANPVQQPDQCCPVC